MRRNWPFVKDPAWLMRVFVHSAKSTAELLNLAISPSLSSPWLSDDTKFVHIGWELRSSLVGETILGVQSEPACTYSECIGAMYVVTARCDRRLAEPRVRPVTLTRRTVTLVMRSQKSSRDDVSPLSNGRCVQVPARNFRKRPLTAWGYLRKLFLLPLSVCQCALSFVPRTPPKRHRFRP